ncbi:hypothetical protein AD945_06285 [Gluconobacter albidus]|uniref:Uncharacterized protein n=1 Tax=Gluconobacter albidus TaxID=318683 RepID=A0A149TK31_9PROT|nr:hypothetical protein [Gluconobacter albidus]KXV48754.1 hypothetical protein AD945_06285 [Gluconobacter albidus]
MSGRTDAVTSPRLRVLESSLTKKQAHFEERLAQHFADVRSANGQPLNDKRNGIATLNRWERQNRALQSLQDGIDLTTRAIERERSAIVRTAEVALPDAIKRGVADGVLLQWRKHPNTFFVSDVDKARIVLLPDGSVAHRYVSSIKDIAQHKKFAKVYNALRAAMDAEERG